VTISRRAVGTAHLRAPRRPHAAIRAYTIDASHAIARAGDVIDHHKVGRW
jgi:hypothetical protein